MKTDRNVRKCLGILSTIELKFSRLGHVDADIWTPPTAAVECLSMTQNQLINYKKQNEFQPVKVSMMIGFLVF